MGIVYYFMNYLYKENSHMIINMNKAEDDSNNEKIKNTLMKNLCKILIL